MRNGTPEIRATARTLAMLEAVVADGGRSSIAALARGIEMPVATAHRQVATLLAQRYLRLTPQGSYVAGPRLLGLLHDIDETQMVVTAAAPLLDALATRLGTIAQLGTLEHDMVTYRIKTGIGAHDLFTKIGMQLEAYCSAIGKVLLAELGDVELAAYLSGGPFPRLTSRTLTDADDLARELARVRESGFATDDAEIAEGLICMAVPIRGLRGRAVAAISISRAGDRWSAQERPDYARLLGEVAGEIECAAFGKRGSIALETMVR